MKKTLLAGLALAMMGASVVSAADIKLSSNFGGDDDNIWSDDFIGWKRKTNKDGTRSDDFATSGKSAANVSERLQLDVNSEKFDGRLRLEFKNIALDGKGANVRFRGYGRFTPIKALRFAAGNEFFTKYGVTGAYMAAADDWSKIGCLAKNGLAVSTSFGLDGLTVAANLGGSSLFDDQQKLDLNFGFDYKIADTVAIGGTAKNVTADERSFGAFFALTSVEDLTFNAGYIYNANDDFLPNGTKNALQASVAYNFSDIGLSLAADVMSGLSNEYVSGDETKEYKNSDGDAIIPFYTRVLVGYDVTENVNLSADLKLTTMLGQKNDATETVLYPKVEYKLPENFGTLVAGVRFTFQNYEDKGGLQKFSVPLCWKWTPVKVSTNK